MIVVRCKTTCKMALLWGANVAFRYVVPDITVEGVVKRMKKRYAAVIAAAGLSSRMCEFKPMVCVGERTMIENVIENLRQAGVEEIVVVTGYKSEILARHLSDADVRLVKNERFAETKMFDSILMGLRHLESAYDAVYITPGDIPLVQPETIRLMSGLEGGIVRPIWQGEVGHPVLVRRDLVPRLLEYSGTGGLRGAIDSLQAYVTDIAVEDMGVTMDGDTPEDVRALRKRQVETRSGGGLWPDIQIRVSRSEAVLSPETAQFLEMIDHTGSIQNACGCMHMSYSRGWRTLNHMEQELGYPLVERFPGGSSGGGSALTREGRQLLHAYQQYQESLRRVAEDLFRELFPADLCR